jgi:hypothetical protein
MNAVWNKLCPQVFENCESYEEASNKIKSAEQLELSIDAANVEELLDARGAGLTNEALTELDAVEDKEQKNAAA